MKVLSLSTPAKINWTLSILGKRSDGYHEIDSVFQAIALYDELMFRAIPEDGCWILTESGDVPRDEQNLIHRAWRLMRERYGNRIGGVEVQLRKGIPVGAGLGGGSSDAAATLVGLGRLFGVEEKREKLAELAAELGSDVPFFVFGGAARCRGRGEIIERLESKLPRIPLALVFPGFSSFTAEAYAAVRPEDYENSEASERAARAIESGNLEQLLGARFNTFDRVLSAKDDRYLEIKKAMSEAGIVGPMLTGSGSTCYGIRRSGVKPLGELLQVKRSQTAWEWLSTESISSGIRRDTFVK